MDSALSFYLLGIIASILFGRLLIMPTILQYSKTCRLNRKSCRLNEATGWLNMISREYFMVISVINSVITQLSGISCRTNTKITSHNTKTCGINMASGRLNTITPRANSPLCWQNTNTCELNRMIQSPLLPVYPYKKNLLMPELQVSPNISSI